jgi:RHS repeat-associated protein
MGNGNLMYTVSHDSSSGKHTVRWESYTSFNMPREFKYGNIGVTATTPEGATSDRTLAFVYGPEHQRVKQTVTLTGNAPTNMMGGTTWYLHGQNNALLFEKELKANGVTENRHYLQAAGMTFALVTTRSGAGVSSTASDPSKRSSQVRYFHQDHLGSMSVITNEVGQVVERLAYDPWGKRREANGLADKSDSLVGQTTDRGYTEHEHLDEIGLIHMNGRVYDPLIGRFMSADTFIQAPGNLQSYNRYAYVMNNPLAYTDPSGYFLKKLFKKKWFRIAVVVGVAYFTAGYVKPLAILNGYSTVGAKVLAGAAGGAAAGATGAAVNGGSVSQIVQAGVQGGLTGALFGAAGTVGGSGAEGANSLALYAAHAGAGCVSSVAGGGNCGQGAVSAVFGKFTTIQIGGVGANAPVGEVIAKGIATAVAGGVGSTIAGGKFENGATTAAFGYLFNQLLSNDEAEMRANQRNRAVMSGACVAESTDRCSGIPANSGKPLSERATDMQDAGAVITAIGLRSGPVSPFLLSMGSALGGFGVGLELYATPSRPATQYNALSTTILTVPFASPGVMGTLSVGNSIFQKLAPIQDPIRKSNN